MTSIINITRTRGDTFPFVITLKDSAGAVIDVSADSFLLTVDPSESPTDNTANLFQLTGTLFTDGTDGKVQFEHSAGNADNVGEYFHDIEQTDGSSKIRTIARGDFILEQDITKNP